MPKWIALLVLFFSQIASHSQESEEKPSEKIAALPKVEDCIPPWISKTKDPGLFPFHNALVTAILAENETAQIHTLQGLNHLHGGWDFEAGRHFAFAMQADPRCLMAHWGMIMSMLAPSKETDPYRFATTQRLLELVSDGEGTELERGFAYSLLKYIEDGPQGAENAFRKVADRFPGEIQSEIFAALFGRGGYDAMGEITPAQAESEKRLRNLVERLPNNSLPLHSLLLIQAEATDLQPSLKLAEKLSELAPNYPPYLHLLGHYQWRCGEFEAAAESFSLAEKLFSKWMETNKVSPTDCPQWTLARSYRAVAYASSGNFKDALAAAIDISKTPLDPKRPTAPGTRQILWDAQTLPARILMQRGNPKDFTEALSLLPTPKDSESHRKHSLSYWWVDGLRITLQAQQQLLAGDLKNATETINVLSFHGQAMSKKQAAASLNDEFSEWRRSFLTLEMLAANLQGQLTLAGPEKSRGSAFNWFRAAADRQRTATLMNPPLILFPMARDLGDYFLATKQPTKALEAYQEALVKFPNHPTTLERIEKVKALTQSEGEDSSKVPE